MPTAPAASASATYPRIRSSSVGVASRSSPPTTARRTVPWPTSSTQSTAGFASSSRSANSPNDHQSHASPRPEPGVGGDLFGAPAGIAGEGRRRIAAVPQDLGGDPLADRVERAGVGGQREVGVRVEVDEARRDREALGIDHAPCRRPGLRLECDDPAAVDGHVGALSGGAGAVEDVTAADEQVDHRATLAGATARRAGGPHAAGLKDGEGGLG